MKMLIRHLSNNYFEIYSKRFGFINIDYISPDWTTNELYALENSQSRRIKKSSQNIYKHHEDFFIKEIDYESVFKLSREDLKKIAEKEMEDFQLLKEII